MWKQIFTHLTHLTIPSLVLKPGGVEDPISTSSTLCWYFRVFSSSCSLKIVDVVFPWLHLELTCVTLTSKNAVTPRDQNPPALKSSLASGLVTALLRLNRSLSRGCSCGSISALVQTLPISEVSRLRTLSYRVSVPRTLPICVTEHCRRYTSHHKHTCLESRTWAFLKRRESQNSCLFSTKP